MDADPEAKTVEDGENRENGGTGDGLANHIGGHDAEGVEVFVREDDAFGLAGSAATVEDDGFIVGTSIFVEITLVKIGIGDEIFPEDNSVISAWELHLPNL